MPFKRYTSDDRMVDGPDANARAEAIESLQGAIPDRSARLRLPPRILARITGAGADSATYEWVGITWNSATSAYVDAGSVSHATHGDAREINGATDVAADTRVWLQQIDQADGDPLMIFQSPAAEAGPKVFPVEVAKTGGADGTDSTTATWTYTVASLTGTTLGTGVPVSRPRPNGSMAFGTTYGLAFYDADGDLVLWDAGEVEATTAECE